VEILEDDERRRSPRTGGGEAGPGDTQALGHVVGLKGVERIAGQADAGRRGEGEGRRLQIGAIEIAQQVGQPAAERSQLCWIAQDGQGLLERFEVVDRLEALDHRQIDDDGELAPAAAALPDLLRGETEQRLELCSPLLEQWLAGRIQVVVATSV